MQLLRKTLRHSCHYYATKAVFEHDYVILAIHYIMIHDLVAIGNGVHAVVL